MRYYSDALEAYLLSHCEPEHEYLHRLWRDINLRLYNGHMTSDHLQGCLLRMFVRLLQPHRILEIGTFGGYSALSMAHALTDDAHLWTYDSNDELEPFTRPWIEQSPWAQRVTYIVGDAVTEERDKRQHKSREKEKECTDFFDFVFLDGDKRTYIEQYEMAMACTTPDALILADNTLWSGKVVEQEKSDDKKQTLGVKAFNDHVTTDKRVHAMILPFRDGMTLLKKKGERG